MHDKEPLQDFACYFIPKTDLIILLKIYFFHLKILFIFHSRPFYNINQTIQNKKSPTNGRQNFVHYFRVYSDTASYIIVSIYLFFSV